MGGCNGLITPLTGGRVLISRTAGAPIPTHVDLTMSPTVPPGAARRNYVPETRRNARVVAEAESSPTWQKETTMTTPDHTSIAVRAESAPHRAPRLPFKMLLIAGSGHAIEVFDWMLFALMAVFISHQFFPPGNESAALLSTLATFAVGFLFRPLGGFLLGRFADKRGRQPALVLSISMMAGASLVIGVLPTYESIGTLAPILLVLARITQGISTGGEVGTAFVYFYERAPEGHRGRYTSFIYMFAGIATLAASLLGLITTRYLPAEAMEQWGWRIGFILGGLLGIYSLIMRFSLSETHDFKNVVSAEGSTATPTRAERPHWLPMVKLILVSGAAALVFYVAVNSLNLYTILPIDGVAASESDAFLALTIGTVAFVFLQYPFGALADRLGIARFVGFGFTVFACLMVPLVFVRVTELWALIVMFTLVLSAAAMVTSVLAAVISSLMPAAMRGTAVGSAFNIGNAILGGTAPFLMASFIDVDAAPVFFIYVICVAAAGAWAAFSSRRPVDGE